MKEKIYETPRIVEIELLVEQAVLEASVLEASLGEYPAFSDELDLGW